jgi:hypothetical protein
LLQHGDVVITARVYAHLRPNDLASAAAILDRPEHERSGTPLHTGPKSLELGKKKPLLSG